MFLCSLCVFAHEAMVVSGVLDFICHGFLFVELLDREALPVIAEDGEHDSNRLYEGVCMYVCMFVCLFVMLSLVCV